MLFRSVKSKIFLYGSGEARNLVFVVTKKENKCSIAEIREACDRCSGNGKAKCSDCGGVGTQQRLVEDKDTYGNIIGRHYNTQSCFSCGGSGKIRCTACSARGFNNLSPTLDTRYDTEKNSVAISEEGE